MNCTVAFSIVIVWLLYPVRSNYVALRATIWLPLVPDVSPAGRGASGHARLLRTVDPGSRPLRRGVQVGIPHQGRMGIAVRRRRSWSSRACSMLGSSAGSRSPPEKFTSPSFARRRKRNRRPTRRRAEYQSEQSSVQPRDLPPINTLDGELTGYDVKFGEDARTRKRVKAEAVEVESEAHEVYATTAAEIDAAAIAGESR